MYRLNDMIQLLVSYAQRRALTVMAIFDPSSPFQTQTTLPCSSFLTFSPSSTPTAVYLSPCDVSPVDSESAFCLPELLDEPILAGG